MLLIDSNIIVYSHEPEFEYLRSLFTRDSFVSEISKVEVLGYHKITAHEELYFNEVLNVIPFVPVSSEIINVATSLRKSYNLKLGDSIIAATALVHEFVLYSRNLKDFEKIREIQCINPVK